MHVAIVAAIGAGRGVRMVESGCVTAVIETIRTLVRSPTPMLLTPKDTVAVSQLSRNGSPSPPVRAGWPVKARLAPATGSAWTQSLMGPKQDSFEPTGMTA